MWTNTYDTDLQAGSKKIRENDIEKELKKTKMVTEAELEKQRIANQGSIEHAGATSKGAIELALAKKEDIQNLAQAEAYKGTAKYYTAGAAGQDIANKIAGKYGDAMQNEKLIRENLLNVQGAQLAGVPDDSVARMRQLVAEGKAEPGKVSLPTATTTPYSGPSFAPETFDTKAAHTAGAVRSTPNISFESLKESADTDIPIVTGAKRVGRLARKGAALPLAAGMDVVNKPANFVNWALGGSPTYFDTENTKRVLNSK